MRSLMSCILKTFGVVLLYYAFLLFLQKVFMVSTLNALMGGKYGVTEMLSFYADSIAAAFFGVLLMLLATPIARRMVQGDERAELSSLHAGDIMLIGICIASLYFLFNTIPAIIQELILLPRAHNLQSTVAHLVYLLLQLCLITIVLIRRSEISNWLSKRKGTSA